MREMEKREAMSVSLDGINNISANFDELFDEWYYGSMYNARPTFILDPPSSNANSDITYTTPILSYKISQNILCLLERITGQ